VSNIDTSLWTSGTVTNHLYYTFVVKYSGTLTSSDVSSMRVYLPGNTKYWNLSPSTTLDTADNMFYATYYTYDTDTLILGTLKAELVLTNGQSSSVSLTVAEPGSSSNSHGYAYIVSEDNTTTTGSVVNAIVRPTSVSAAKTSGTESLTVNFTLNDSRILNGWVALYDSSHNYLGSTPYFVNANTGSKSSYLNAGSGINTTSANVLSIPLASCSSSTGTAIDFSTVSECVVIATDGGQYVSNGYYDQYDCISMGKRTTFTSN
jgi:hypothetical protein